ncbi:hypothetical protein LGN17_28270 [Burkholderia sp. AU30280]|uniref:hypothetical protein n=1 Tax=Burkholderia sp. AU30280 TaxID=2879628 RepID=UPI001CF37E8B|nr:hypothetical protein [Burkholderia sp. AU30280]MCA8276384.1 hypothetical protein [Burkholderia sp. AU30280]
MSESKAAVVVNIASITHDHFLHRANKILAEIRFTSLVELVEETIHDPNEVIEILFPLMTRTPRIRWHDLIPHGSPWRGTVEVLKRMMAAIERCRSWSRECIDDAIRSVTLTEGESSYSVNELLYRCVLFSEYRLPLVESLEYLGIDECLSRLQYVNLNLISLNRIG